MIVVKMEVVMSSCRAGVKMYDTFVENINCEFWVCI